MTTEQIRRLCTILIFLGIAGRFYGLADPWKRNDHYNFGGVWTSTYTDCLKTTPLSVSKAVPHHLCHTGKPHYYRAHPPTVLFGLWGWTSLFGESEAAHRSFTLFFSLLNIALIFSIARTVRPDAGVFPWLAAAFQSVFLAGIYFGTHIDFICEFTVFFVLLSALFALKGRLNTAIAMAFLAGISSWPGYISFGPLWLYALSTRRGGLKVFLSTIAAFGLALATMMWLHQTFDIADFLRMKLLDPGYIKKTEKGWLEPLRFLSNYITSLARLLSPAFAAIAVFELLRGAGRSLFTSWRERWRNLGPTQHAVLLTGGTGVFYSLIGHEFFMVHVFLYLLFTPALALMAAVFVEKRLLTNVAEFSRRDLIWLTLLSIAFAALYPYGIYKTNAVHDALNSVLFIVSALSLIAAAWRKRLTGKFVLSLMIAGAAGNVSQTMNYRNEPDTERSFCEKAREEFQRTGQTVHTKEEHSHAKDFYCREIPVQYDSDSPIGNRVGD